MKLINNTKHGLHIEVQCWVVDECYLVKDADGNTVAWSYSKEQAEKFIRNQSTETSEDNDDV